MANANPLSSWTAAQAAAEIARGAVTAQDYTRACLDRIAEVEPEIQAFAHLDPEHAMAQAKALDERKARGMALGPLHGVPVAIKDIIDTSDFPTECGSPFSAGRRPYQDAHVVQRLREAGAVIIGKTVTTEFAYFHPGKTRNPHDTERTPGGSSSGSAAAVASGMVPLALGTQTNGSVIRPAAFCGVYGLKPSKGLVSRYGVLPLSPSFDVVGPFARSFEDIALITGVIAGLRSERPRHASVRGRQFPGGDCREISDRAADRLRAHAGLGRGRCADARGLRAARRQSRRRLRAHRSAASVMPRPGRCIAP